MSATMGQKVAGQLLGFFGYIAIIVVGLFYCFTTLLWVLPERSFSEVKLVGYYCIVLLVGAVAQSFGGIKYLLLFRGHHEQKNR